ncbi:MAG: dihydrodipicolinate synthase family protein [Candidatus Koribacter versatilis]|uniref:Dihydrodipicolinate synthase family protein n=1 Tax=Candidatus Korobacter versatilis TaxID=658062 RepID=A0A932A6E8_9BACT|nr:dihydrodipicolinate synthase family protein [Candidatus Koribacter versatilis]
MLLHGIFPAVTTPFYPDGSVYFRKLEHNLDRYSKSPVAGVVVLGSTGEAVMLSDEEKREVMKAARHAVTPEKVLIAGSGAESARTTLELTEYAAKLGYDVALIRTPHYYKPQMRAAEVLAFYRFVADRSPLPILLYSVPAFTGYDLPEDLVTQLAEHRNILGIKESGGDVEKIKHMVTATRHIKRQATVTEVQQAVTRRMLAAPAAGSAPMAEFVPAQSLGGAAVATAAPVSAPRSNLKTRTKEVGFQVVAGSAHKLKASLDAGAVGAVLAFADPAPTACFEIFAAWKDGDMQLAEEKQERIREASTALVVRHGIPATKYAMDLNGYYGGPPRLPLLPLDASVKAEVERLMADIRN